jgi:hypothetical protein
MVLDELVVYFSNGLTNECEFECITKEEVTHALGKVV